MSSVAAPRQKELSDKFFADLSKFAEELGPLVDAALQKAVFDIFEAVIIGSSQVPSVPKGTPVDTGFARASWWVSINSYGSPTQPSQNPDRTRTVRYGTNTDPGADLFPKLSVFTAGDRVYLLTNTEYMLALEFGHSQQAPVGMVREVVAAGPAIVEHSAKVFLSTRR